MLGWSAFRFGKGRLHRAAARHGFGGQSAAGAGAGWYDHAREIGEQPTAGRDFYAVFSTDEEWRIVCGGRTLGAIPISKPAAVEVVIAFAGQRWRIAVQAPIRP